VPTGHLFKINVHYNDCEVFRVLCCAADFCVNSASNLNYLSTVPND
jgi:hypothetical protein